MDILAELFDSESDNVLNQEDIELGPANVAPESESVEESDITCLINYSTREFDV